MDILGPLPTSTNGNRYLLVITDHFTKWVEAFPLANQTAETIATILIDEIFARYGVPENILTDRGKNFIGETITWLEKKLNIEQLRTSSMHPQTNALTERFNKTIAEMLSAYVSLNQKDWDQLIGGILLAYRTSQHPSTGYSPFYMMFGREPREPTQLIEVDILNEEETPSQYVANLLERLKEAYNQARLSEERARQTRENYWKKRNTDHNFKVGDRVMMYSKQRKTGRTFKLAPHWRGPYVIEKFITPVTITLRQMFNKKKMLHPIHVSRLKQFHEREEEEERRKKE